ncbi:MAG TPA: M20 family metallopeptidase, partial [Lacunisphaera sp.]|jgi:acetylornithine deacetylase|nr:M20 family metallopeptidase [Lacunisphaera sp.]
MPSLSPPQSCEELLAQMVAIETVNPSFGGPAGGEAALATHLESLAAHWGLQSRRCPVADGAFNLLITSEVGPDAEWLLFESHLDTVSVDGMTVPPFKMTVAGERLHGRGTCDTKGTGAAMLWALQEYARQPGRTRNAGIIFAVDEEAQMTGAQAFAAGEVAAFKKLRGIVVGEPTNLRPVVAHNGALRWRTITRGVAAHSADPTKGRSAIHAMLRVVEALEARFLPQANREFALTGRAAASINVIRGGSAVNIIPDYCEIICDRRLVPGETAAQVLAERDAALAGLAVEHDGQYLAPPLPPESSASLHAWAAPALTACGLDATAIGAPYATDASHYAAAGAQVLVLGPGALAQAHTKDEWLDRRELAKAVTVYGALLSLP